MCNYDINILKNNISKLMKEKGITQTDLAREINMQQSGVSVALDEKKSSCFTIAQLVDIKEALGCTMDELFLPPDKQKNNKNNIETVSDILEMLFKIDDSINFNIRECGTNGYITDLALVLPLESLQIIIYEWAQLKETTLDEPLKSNIIKHWQEDTLKKYKSFIIENILISSIKKHTND